MKPSTLALIIQQPQLNTMISTNTLITHLPQLNIMMLPTHTLIQNTITIQNIMRSTIQLILSIMIVIHLRMMITTTSKSTTM